MGDLPESRVNLAPAFSKVGTDFFDPILIKEKKFQNRNKVKAYGCVFICMSTKAVHLEIINDLTTEGFLGAPNVYTIPSALSGTKESNITTAPAFSILGRQKIVSDVKVLVPGPGSYESVKFEAVRSRSPAYSISSRYQLPNNHSQIPGPGAHYPEKVVLNIPPSHTFGIRHSPHICSLKDVLC
ncbi:outer dense fiber protein 3-like [Copidosoma floridanum]|uniref:outer dense fiber protein 3-like n=1 Tax=Copidosoma floridanum TaxID=29053 RepID=UPI0006C9AEB3|nr:outer dense fiber protein 3-like [Copidosoma floridanum]